METLRVEERNFEVLLFSFENQMLAFSIAKFETAPSEKDFKMSVIGYFEAFPQKTKTELRTAILPEGGETIPVGAFLFMEYFCTDLSCNCERVIIKVLHAKSESDQHPREVATISYTWSPGEDEVWLKTNAEFSNPFLDPFHKQASYADELLEFWGTWWRTTKPTHSG